MSIYVLSYENHKLYHKINESILSHQKNLKLPSIDSNMILSVYNKVLSENPEGILYKVGSVKLVTSILGSSLVLNKNENLIKNNQMNRIITERDKIVSIAKKENNYYDAILAVYRFFVMHYQYSERDDESFHQIYSPLLYNKAVCEGFSLLFSEILNLVHIPCGVVCGSSNFNGKQEPHSWNIVKYKNYYYHLDVTWDICTKDHNNESLDYFMLDDNLIRKDHSWEDPTIPKCMDSKEEYYERNRMVCNTENELIRYLSERIKRSDCTISYRFNGINDQVTMSEKMISRIIDIVFRANNKSYSQIVYRINEASGTVTIYLKYR